MYLSSENIEQKFKVIASIITSAGALPFITVSLFVIFSENYNFLLFPIIIYSGLIICFVCGANWMIILSGASKSKSVTLKNYLIFIFNSLIPIVLSGGIIFNEGLNKGEYNFAFAGLLLISLLIFDIIFFFNNMIEAWWFKLRIFGSLLSGVSLIGINLILI